MSEKRETWSGRVGFILATVGSAVGLGSIWKFPYEVGANGGSAFVLFYLVGLIAIVVPLMFAEFAIGRSGRGDPITSIAVVAAAHGASRSWAIAGALGVATGFVILSFYSVIGGWTLGHAAEAAFTGLAGSDPDAVRSRYQLFLASPWRMLGYHALFMASAAAIVARGIGGGIETAAKIMMPILTVLMVALAAYAAIEGDLAATMLFLFKLDPHSVSARAALDALGLGFFSIGVGLGLMITYAAYGGQDIDLKQVAIASVLADTGISLLAGFAVFPIVFAHGLDPAGGPGLVFVTLPLAFAQMPFGRLTASAFYVLLFVAALASAISMLELVVAMLVRRLRWRRAVAAWIAAATCFGAGIPTLLSFNLWSGWFPLSGIEGFQHATVFDLLDYLTSNILLPVGGFAIALFAGWAIRDGVLTDELRLGRTSAAALRFTLRYIAPIGIGLTALAPFWI
jgi:neurotransmitter:Na+ symporter, NSS family